MTAGQVWHVKYTHSTTTRDTPERTCVSGDMRVKSVTGNGTRVHVHVVVLVSSSQVRLSSHCKLVAKFTFNGAGS